MKIEITLAGNPVAYLNEFGKYSKLALIEQSSKAGKLGMDSIRNEFRNETTEWSKEYKDGKLTFSKKTSKLGMRLNHQKGQGTAANPDNMLNMIDYFTHQTTGTTVIMGGHKAHYPVLVKNGEMKGYGTRQSGIARRTLSILEKLNSGEIDEVYQKHRDNKSFITGQFKGNQRYKRRNWAERGWDKAYSQIKEEMTTKLHNLITNFESKKGEVA